MLNVIYPESTGARAISDRDYQQEQALHSHREPTVITDAFMFSWATEDRPKDS